MQDPDLLTLFVDPLNALGVSYAVTGAVASVIYGEPRLTTDIDIVLRLTQPDVSRLHSCFDPEAFYVPPEEALSAEAARASHGHFNIIHNASYLRADFYLAGADPLQEWALEAVREIEVGGRRVCVAPAEYVIVQKLIFRKAGGSDKHLHDIRAMVNELGDAIDLETLHAQIDKLSLRVQWDEVISGRST